ncbi:MAG: PepSY domain-containing protein, partial [Gammaproteobacteria bacterium]
MNRSRTFSRRQWFRWHGYLSLPLWLLFAFVCLTGTIAVISHELTWLTNPAARAVNPAGLPARPLAELASIVQAELPDAVISHIMVFEPYLVTVMSISRHAEPDALVYINPYTGVIQSVHSGLTFIGFMRSLHGWLLFPWQHSYSIGYYLVSVLSLVCLGALVTGLVVYRRFWHSVTQPRLRCHHGTRTLLGDWHRLTGVWSLWFLLVIGSTGLWYLTQAIMWHSGYELFPSSQPVATQALPVTAGEPPPMIPLALAIERAQQRFPELQVSWVSMPEHSRDSYHISGSGAQWWYDHYSWKASIDPWSGNMTSHQSPAQLSALQTLSH